MPGFSAATCPLSSTFLQASDKLISGAPDLLCGTPRDTPWAETEPPFMCREVHFVLFTACYVCVYPEARRLLLAVLMRLDLQNSIKSLPPAGDASAAAAAPSLGHLYFLVCGDIRHSYLVPATCVRVPSIACIGDAADPLSNQYPCVVPAAVFLMHRGTCDNGGVELDAFEESLAAAAAAVEISAALLRTCSTEEQFTGADLSNKSRPGVALVPWLG